MKVIVILACLVLSVTCMAISQPNPATSHEEIRDLPLGTLVKDYNGLIMEKEGNLSCWMNKWTRRQPHEPVKPTKSVLSKPIYKYCMYQLIEKKTGPHCDGYWLNTYEMDNYAHAVFAANPSQTVVFISDKTTTATRDTIDRYFLCNTSGCNVPVDIMSFLKFNTNQTPAPEFEIESNPTVPTRGWTFESWP